MESPFRVFICGTREDFCAEREGALSALRHIEQVHNSMEFFGARHQASIETCLHEVRRSDILVVIIAHLYGSIVENLGVSYTEAEYDEGHQLGKPCLIYLRDDNTPIMPKVLSN